MRYIYCKFMDIPTIYDNKQTVIVIPFGNLRPEENRYEQLRQYISHMLELDNHLTIIVVEQIEPLSRFCRGQLLNIGVYWYINNLSLPFKIILHDVDILPDNILYKKYIDLNIEAPCMLLPSESQESDQAYGKDKIGIGGAITSIKTIDFLRVNGFPNNFWGWGAEDTAFENRLVMNNIETTRNIKEGTFKNIDNTRNKRQDKWDYILKNNMYTNNGGELLQKDNIEWSNNGINQLKNMQYEIKNISIKKIKNFDYIHIKVILDKTGLI